MDCSTLICWKSPFSTDRVLCVIILGLFGSRQKLLLADCEDPDQMLHYAVWSGSALFASVPLLRFPNNIRLTYKNNSKKKKKEERKGKPTENMKL